MDVSEVIEYPLGQNCQPENSWNFHRRNKQRRRSGNRRDFFLGATWRLNCKNCFEWPRQ
jgi:hypothetical protein